MGGQRLAKEPHRKETSGLSSTGSEGADNGPSRLQKAERPGEDVKAGSDWAPGGHWGGDYDLRGHQGLWINYICTD